MKLLISLAWIPLVYLAGWVSQYSQWWVKPTQITLIIFAAVSLVSFIFMLAGRSIKKQYNDAKEEIANEQKDS